MLALDRDAFICDMAETYHIFDIRSIPVSLLAVLASGLGVNSRIRLKREGLSAPWDVVLTATLIDMWSSDDDARIAQRFLAADKKKESNFKVFNSIEEFEEEKARIIASSSHEEEK